MELGFVESLRRRWSVLGIDVKGKGKAVTARDVRAKETKNSAGDPWEGLGEVEVEDDASRMDVDADADVGEDESARREIMDGAIARSAITSAVKGA